MYKIWKSFSVIGAITAAIAFGYSLATYNKVSDMERRADDIEKTVSDMIDDIPTYRKAVSELYSNMSELRSDMYGKMSSLHASYAAMINRTEKRFSEKTTTLRKSIYDKLKVRDECLKVLERRINDLGGSKLVEDKKEDKA